MPGHSLYFEAIGTQWLIETQAPLPEAVRSRTMAMIEAYDKTYSRFRSDSLVSAIASQAGVYTFPDDAPKLFALYEQLYELTDGKMTPLVGRLLEELGYDADYSLKRRSVVQAVPRLETVLTRSARTITTTRPLVIDIGAAGKGYLVDKIAAILDESESTYTIDASGDMRISGNKIERIGLEDPRNPERVIGVVELKNNSMCGSATQRRAWGDGLHHIVDPDTRQSTTGILASWVITKEAVVADGLATALFFVPGERLASSFDFAYVCLRVDGSVDYSSNFKGELFI